MKKLLILFLAFALVMPLASCGKRGPLEAPPGGNPQYPQKYPR